MEWKSDYPYPYPCASPFDQLFRCLPFGKNSDPDLQTGNKIILPLSALAGIIESGLPRPFPFKIVGFNNDKISHCSALQFDAEEDTVHLPDWMMKNLSLSEGALVVLRDARLPRGEYIQLRPHTTSFFDLANPREVMKQGLRGFTCLSRGDTFMIKHGETDFWFDVLNVEPGEAISLIDTDCRLDFAPPLDYKEPQRIVVQEGVNRGEKKEEVKVFRPFSGAARWLDGTAVMGGAAAVVKEEKKREKDGGKEELFKPFTGRSRVLGGGPYF